MRERSGGPIPARITLLDARGAPRVPEALLEGDMLLGGDGCVLAPSGVGRVRLAPGPIRVLATRGPEWSLARAELELAPGEARVLELELVHEIETPGWLAADLRVEPELVAGRDVTKVRALVEGLELVVTRVPQAAAAPEADGPALWPGVELETPFGSLHAFPRSTAPAGEAPTALGALLDALRAPASDGRAPLVQLPHPRLHARGAFARLGLDAVTGAGPVELVRGLDALEVLSGNAARGYRAGALAHAASDAHAVLDDWFHLLELGLRPTALGNSGAGLAGTPRNYLKVAPDAGGRVAPAEVAAALRAGAALASTGPFLELDLAGAGPGATARASDGHARLALRVRAASWIDCDRVRVWLNGAEVATRTIADARGVLRLEEELELCLLGACARHGRVGPTAGPFDAWVVVAVEGDEPLAHVPGETALPLALANPIRIDGDGDGAWTAPRARLEAELAAQATPAIAKGWFERLRPEEQVHALAVVPRGTFAAELIEHGLASPAPPVRRAAARAAERVAVTGMLSGVQRAWSANADDAYLGVLLLRVLASARPEAAAASLAAFLQRFGGAAAQRYASELPVLARTPLGHWRALGPLEGGAALAGEPPAADARAEGAGATVAWRELSTTDGRVTLAGAEGECSAYFETYVHVREARPFAAVLSSASAARVWLGEREVGALAGAERAAEAGTETAWLVLEPAQGWNRLVVRLAGRGELAFELEAFEPALESASGPR